MSSKFWVELNNIDYSNLDKVGKKYIPGYTF